MILRHADVRSAAKDWKTFSSDAPFRIPIPSEEEMRTIRQLPIEVDPPDHTDYRKIVEPFFKRAKDAGVIAKVEALIDRLICDALGGGPVEVVRQFALPIQSHALTYLLNVPEAEAETWIAWGTHVFRDVGAGEKKGAALEDYLERQLDRAAKNPGEDFFSALNQATFRDRPLSHEEMLGFANLTFAGGRDTVINTITSIIGYIGDNPKVLTFLRENPKRIVNAGEEFFRTISPLTHIGRVCPVTTDVHGQTVEPNGRPHCAGPRRTTTRRRSNPPKRCASTASRTPTSLLAVERTCASAPPTRGCSPGRCWPNCANASAALKCSRPRSSSSTRPNTLAQSATTPSASRSTRSEESWHPNSTGGTPTAPPGQDTGIPPTRSSIDGVGQDP